MAMGLVAAARAPRRRRGVGHDPGESEANRGGDPAFNF